MESRGYCTGFGSICDFCDRGCAKRLNNLNLVSSRLFDGLGLRDHGSGSRAQG